MPDLSLLFKLKAQNETAAGINAARTDVQKLKQTFGSEFPQMQRIATTALESVTSSLTNVSSQVPIVGTAVSGLTSALSSVSASSTSASAGLAGIAGPAGLAVVAIGALAVGLVKVGEAIFDLSKQSAEFEGKFFDLSQQVGVAVETLSTLDIIASTTGGNIETVTAALGIFQKNLEDSHDPTSKEAKLLKELGVTSLDTELAIRQTLAGLFKLGEGSKQTSAVLQLFGRSGRFVNAILKESHGDLDKTADKFLVVTSEAARAADQFNDLITILGRQKDAIERGLVADTIPVLIVALQDLSGSLGRSKEDFNDWADVIREVGTAIKIEVAAIIGTLQGLAQFIASRGSIDLGIAVDANIRALLDRAEQLKNRLKFESDIESTQRLTRQILAGAPGDRPDAEKAVGEAAARAAKDISLQQKALEESTRRNREQLERERRLDLKNIDEWEEASIAALNEHVRAQEAIFDQEAANNRRFITNQADLLLAERELVQKRIQLKNEELVARQKIEEDAQSKRDGILFGISRRSEAIRDEARRGELDKIQADLDAREITEETAINRRLALLQDEHEGRLLLINEELRAASTSADRHRELVDDRILAEQKFTNEVARLTRARIDARNREIAAETPRPGGPILEDGKINLENLGPPPEAEKRFRGLQAALDDLGKSLGNLVGTSKDFGIQFGDVIGGAVDALAFGIGDLVNQWVLLGDTGPAAMRKLTASVLAGLAAQAAVKTIFQLAEGFASLFFNPAEAAAHFQSAALFGAVAGAAAVAGRGLAGDLFKNPSGSGKGGDASGGERGQLNPIVLGRNQPQTQTIIVKMPTINVNPSSKFGQAITAEWADDYSKGGITRELVFNDVKV